MADEPHSSQLGKMYCMAVVSYVVQLIKICDCLCENVTLHVSKIYIGLHKWMLHTPTFT